MRSQKTKVIISAIVVMTIFLMSAVQAAEHRETIIYLNNDPNAHVPEWDQPKDSGFSMGCGPTAWAIVYGYWKENKGKDQLFEGNSIDTSENGKNAAPVVTATSEIAKHVSTYYREKFDFDDSDVKRPGGTNSMNMPKGIKYAQAHGYSHSRCWKISGSEFDKFEHIKRYLLSDRPVILTYDTEGHGATNHFGVIETHIPHF